MEVYRLYKILIVDDEELVRKAIVSKLDWAGIGFGEVEQAEDGEQALEIALKFKPDIVLTDIRMPFMDGLELAECLKTQLPQTKVIILTGHDEFEYAQDAIKAGVMDYILKPVHAAALRELMEKARSILDNEHEEKEKLYKLKIQLHQSLPLLKDKFLISLVNNSFQEKELEKKLEYLDIRFSWESFIVCVSEIDNLNVLAESSSAEDTELLMFSFLNIASELLGSSGMVFNDFNNRQIVLYNFPPVAEHSDLNRLYTILEEIRNNLAKYFNITVTTGIGREVGSLRDIHRSYQDALHVLDYKIIMGKNRIYDIRDLGYRKSEMFYPIDGINELLSKIKLEGIEEVTQCTEGFFNELMEKKNISPDNIKIILSELINGAQKIIMEMKDESKVQAAIDFGIYEEIGKYETLEEMKAVVVHYLSGISKAIHAARNSRNLQIINKAKQYIDNSYKQDDLSLNQVAALVSVSPGYLSILFRKETNQTFIEYLTMVRMEKAKGLLKTSSLKSYEVAYNVGFSDPHYFSLSFKKYTGVTPSDYKAGG